MLYYLFYYYFCAQNSVSMDYVSLIKSPISAEMEAFRQVFDASLCCSNPLLERAVRHIRKRNGKMMRPMLVMLSARMFGAEVCEATIHAAASLELLHTASLVHDDVVDESGERRGQLSVNALYNNKVAVLVGDFLLATSLVEVGKTANSRIVDVVSMLGRELADGELLQLDNVDNMHFSEEVYFDVIRKKTAALFASCAKAGALSVGMSDEQVETARQLGEYIGLCFQIKDDIFDYYEDERQIGKPTGNDMLEGKLTLPVLYALNSTHDEQAVQWALKVKRGAADSDEIARLIVFAKAHGGIEYAAEVMERYHRQAAALLECVCDSEVRQALQAYLDYVVERSY